MKVRRTVTVSDGKALLLAVESVFVSHEKTEFEINRKAVMTQDLAIASALIEVTDFCTD